MPRKRPLEVRLAEAEERTDRLKLEKSIIELRAKMGRRVKKKRRR